MADLHAAIAAAREALERYYESEDYGVSPIALRDLLAALDAAQGEAVAWRWPGGNWQDGEPDALNASLMQRYSVRPELAYAAPQAPPAAVAAGYDEDEIADACMMAEVPDSKYEAIITYLSDNRRAMLAAARKGE